jgi:DNA topoisomerase-2
LLAKLASELQVLSNRARFIKSIIDGKLIINSRKRQDIESDLATMSFDKIDGSYTYLISMPIHSLTQEKFDELNKTVKDKQDEVDRVEKTSHIDMYKTDLKELRKKVV